METKDPVMCHNTMSHKSQHHTSKSRVISTWPTGILWRRQY